MSKSKIEQAIKLLESGHADRAEAICRGILAEEPDRVDTLNLLGAILNQTERPTEAIELLQRAVAHAADNPAVWSNLASAYLLAHLYDDALAAYQQALTINPAMAQGWFNLGIVFKLKKQYAQAVEAFRRAQILSPGDFETCHNLGSALLELKQYDAAAAEFQRATRLRPDDVAPYINWAAALQKMPRLNEAVAVFERAMQVDPRSALVYYNLGNTFHALGRLDDAIGAFQKAVDCEPGFSDARNNLANTLKDVGDLPRAMAQYDRELSLRPGNWTVGSNRLYTMYFHPEFDPARILEEHRKWNQSHAEPLAAQIREHDNDPSAHRRLRIGYVSADFRQHPVGLAFEPLLANHDREQFEIYCFGTSGIEDRVTERIRTSANHWHSVKALNDADFPQLIRRCRIDILVDLTLHMGHHRLLAFAQKPAPVQMTYLGYPGTTGVRAIDYRLSDPIIDPPGSERWHSEQTLCLPRTYLCWRWGGAEIPISELPAKNRGVTFGSLNNFCKVTPQVLGVWGKLMAKVKDSRLVLKCPPGSASERVRKLLAASGIAADRIELTSSLPWEEYSRLYHRIDITLDPFPYPGHTTSLDGLWMGVPVVTLRGKTSVGRAGASLLHNLKLQELVAEDEDQYIQIAAGLAQDLPRLGGLRQSLRERLRASPIMDEPGFARDVEGVYRQAWRTWCARGKS